MPDLEDDLQATSDALLRDLDRLRDLEEQKRALDPRDPRVEELSIEIEELTRRTMVKATAEREIAAELRETPATNDA